MNRTEAVNQLNLEKKRRENAVWEQWLGTESSGNVTSVRLQKRTADLRQIQNEYDDAVFKLNNIPIKEALPPQTQRTQKREGGPLGQKAAPPQQGAPKNQQPRTGVPRTTPNDDILKGAENLPENKPLNLGLNPNKKNIDGIQNPENRRNEPPLVQQAREQNRSAEIREAQNQNQNEEYSSEEGDASEEDQDTARANAIRDEFSAAGIEVSDVTDSTNDKDLIGELKEAKKLSSINFPFIILGIAIAKDCSDILSSILETVPGFGLVVWFFAAGFSLSCSAIIWFWMLGKGSKAQRKIIIHFVEKRLPLIMVGLFAELIPYISLIPTTTITVFFIAQTSTQLGQTIHKAVEKSDDLKK